MAAVIERRRACRAELALPISIVADDMTNVPGEIRNVSRTGMLVLAGVTMNLKRVVRLSFTVQSDRECAARGTVVRSEPEIAIDFIEMNEEMREFLEATISLRPALVSDFVASIISPTLTIS